MRRVTTARGLEVEGRYSDHLGSMQSCQLTPLRAQMRVTRTYIGIVYVDKSDMDLSVSWRVWVRLMAADVAGFSAA